MTDREPFAMVPQSVIVGLAGCPHCALLYAWLDLEVGGQPAWDRTLSMARRDLAWWPRTIQKHANHLAARGLVTLNDGAGKSPRMALRHQPARGMVADGVELPEPVMTARQRGGRLPYGASDERAIRGKTQDGASDERAIAARTGPAAAARRALVDSMARQPSATDGASAERGTASARRAIGGLALREGGLGVGSLESARDADGRTPAMGSGEREPRAMGAPAEHESSTLRSEEENDAEGGHAFHASTVPNPGTLGPLNEEDMF